MASFNSYGYVFLRVSLLVSSSLQDMYQLINHIFYDGRHLFEQGEQALRLREKPRGSSQKIRFQKARGFPMKYHGIHCATTKFRDQT